MNDTPSKQAKHAQAMLEDVSSELNRVNDRLVTLLKRYGLSRTQRQAIFALVDRQTELWEELHRWVNELTQAEHRAMTHRRQARQTPPADRTTRPRQG